MKRRIIACLSLSTIMSIGVSIALVSSNTKASEVKGYDASSLPTTIDLNDSTASEIRSYYSSLNSLTQSERQGTNLLKNLKTILKNGQQYFCYDDSNAIWQMYEITDRDWDKSPASSTTYGTYDAVNNQLVKYSYGSNSNPKNDPYVHALYVNRDVTNETKAWGDHTQTNWGINREHVWPKAEGFEDTSTDPDSTFGGARGDPMHLMAGNGYANNIHSNYFYGYVDTSSTYTNCGSKYTFTSGNLLGRSKTVGGSKSVFEPQKSDRGDIARAIFYMVARYNYLSGSDSDGISRNNPNLSLSQSLSDWSSSAFTSTTTNPGYMGIMTDLLAWHKEDPVDAYEIHRNNLLYKNYSKNRNPFIDFPEWADYIWGTATYNGRNYVSYNSNPTGYAVPSSDTINGYNTSSDIKSVTVSPDSLNLDLSGTRTGNLTATVTVINGASKTVTWSTSDSSVATVNNGVVTAVGKGACSIIATSTVDQTKSGSCTVNVIDSSSTEVAASVSIEEYAEENNWSNSSKYTSVAIDDIATASVGVGGGNTGKYYTSGYEWRFYQSEKATLVLSVADGYELDSATLSFNTSNSGQLFDVDGNAVTSGQSVSISGSSATFTVSGTSTGGQIKFTNIEVVYHKLPSVDPTLSWVTPSIDVFSGSTLTASGANNWNVVYNDGQGHNTPLTSSQFTVLLDNSPISLPYSWQGDDNNKTLCVSYNNLKTETTSVTITQTLQDIVTPDSHDTWDYTITSQLWTAFGDKTLDGKVWTTSGTPKESTTGYWGIYNADKGQQFGKASDPFTTFALTSSSFEGVINSVTIYTSGANGISATVQVSVGGVAYGSAKSITSTNAGYTFDLGGESGDIVISWSQTSSKALYVKEIIVDYGVEGRSLANDASHKVAQRAVVKFARAFNNALGATNSCTTGLSNAWSTATNAWNTFLSEIAVLGTNEEAFAKELIKYATAQWTKNTDEDYSYCLERALATYDKCVNAYGMTAFMNSVRQSDSVSKTPNTTLFEDTSDVSLIIIVISVISLCSFFILLCVKKRRKN